MPVIEPRSVLSGIPVSEAMRRQVISLDASADIGQCIRTMIRTKANAVLLLFEDDVPYGVVSKTDLTGAFYAEFPLETPLSDVMGSQPIACFPDDPVETALEIMEAAKVHRLYVTGANREEVIGTLSYSDIVGLIYRYCSACDRGIFKKKAQQSGVEPSSLFTVNDVMTNEVLACRETDQLYTVMEILSENTMGAVLVQNDNQSPIGVISKTDFIVAFHHGISPAVAAREIMASPVCSVPSNEQLTKAIQRMLIWDIQRLFVHNSESGPGKITGVLSLSDAARFRSGSCKACTAGRIIIQ
jgi:CBS domain-containing protein